MSGYGDLDALIQQEFDIIRTRPACSEGNVPGI